MELPSHDLPVYFLALFGTASRMIIRGRGKSVEKGFRLWRALSSILGRCVRGLILAFKSGLSGWWDAYKLHVSGKHSSGLI